MMLGGNIRQVVSKPEVKMSSPPSSKGQSLLSMNKGVVLVRGPAPVPHKNDPRVLMVPNVRQNVPQVFGKNTVLVPVTQTPDGKMIATGAPVLPPRLQTSGKIRPDGGTITGPNGQQVLVPLPPGAMVRTAPQGNKPIVLMSAKQTGASKQPMVIQVPKGPNNPGARPLFMVPVTSSGVGQHVTGVAGKDQTVKVIGQNKGVNLVQMPLTGGDKSRAAQSMFIPMPVSGKGPGQPMVLLPRPQNQPVKQIVRLPGGTSNTKSVIIQDPNMANLPKGARLIPMSSSVPGGPVQLASSHGAFPGGKIVFIPNSNAGGIPGGKTVINIGASSQLKKPNLSLIQKVFPPKGGRKLLYKPMGASVNKPIKPKPPIQTTDSFFKTPIEIKPLEEEHDDDLENVLSALTGGGGSVDLMPVNSAITSSPSPAPVNLDPVQIDGLESMGLKIDSVYSLSSNSLPGDGEQASKKSQEASADTGKTLNKKSEKKDSSTDGENNTSVDGENVDKEREKVIQEPEVNVDKKDREPDREEKQAQTNDDTKSEVMNARRENTMTEGDSLESGMDPDDDRLSVDSDQTEVMDTSDLYKNDNGQEDLIDRGGSSEKEDSIGKEQEMDDCNDSDGEMKDIQVPVLSIEPLSPEDEPSQSGSNAKPEQSLIETETEMEFGDPQNNSYRRISLEDEDPNLMRGDCLQVRLAQQAARQLQEQMKQESENRDMVAREWHIEEDDEEMDQPFTPSKDLNNTASTDEDGRKEESEEKTRETPEDNESHPSESDGKKSEESNNDPKEGPSNEEDGRGEGKKTGDGKKGEGVMDDAQKALVAAALNGCEVADSAELNDMFDELISEYFTAPERPKPSVRVRGIEECRADLDDGPQSLVTTTKTTPSLHTVTSLSPLNKSLLSQKPISITTPSGPVTLVQVKVPVPGKPGVSTIKYIPVQLSKLGKTGLNNAPMPQYVKIVPNTTSTVVSGAKPMASRLIPTVANQRLGVASSSVASSSIMKQGKSVLKFVIAPGNRLQPNLTSSVLSTASVVSRPTTIPSTSASASSTKPLSNVDLESAIKNAARNVLGLNPGNKWTGLKPSKKPSLIPGRNLLPLVQTGVSLAQSGVSLAQPGFSLAQPGVSLAQPGVSLTQPGVSLAQPAFSLTQPGVTLVQPGVSLTQPGVSLTQPGVSLAQPGVSLAQPGVTLAQPGVSLAQTGVSVSLPVQAPTLGTSADTNKPDKTMHLLTPDNNRIIVIPPGMKLVQGPGKVPQLVMVNKPDTEPPTSLSPGDVLAAQLQRECSVFNPKKKKKKKKKKKIKLPPTKQCSVVLRRLNMKVVKKTLNLKRIKPSFLFETVSRRPMRGAKRKAEELISNDAKRFKTEEKYQPPKHTEVPDPPPPPVEAPTTSTDSTSPSRVNIAKDSALYQIMSQLPPIRPAPTIQQTPLNILPLSPGVHTSPMKPPPGPVSFMPNPRTSLLQKSPKPSPVVSSPLPNVSPSLIMAPINRLLPPSSTTTTAAAGSREIKLTLSCTTAASSTMPVNITKGLNSIAMSMSGSNVVSGTVVSPSHTVVGRVDANRQTGSTGGNVTSLLTSTNQPSRPLPPLHPAGKVMIPNILTRPRFAMPTLQPAPRPVQGVRGPIQPPTPATVMKSPTTFTPRAPIVIQPNGTGTAPRPPFSQGNKLDTNKRFLLIKTANGQFLVPMPEHGNPINLAGARPVKTNNLSNQAENVSGSGTGETATSSSSGASGTVQTPSSPIVIGSTKDTTTPPLPTPPPPPPPPPPVKESNRRKRHVESPVIVIKDEPIDTDYDKYENSPPPKAKTPDTQVKIKEEKEREKEREKEEEDRGEEIEEEEEDAPRVPASLNHMKRIEELKARLRQHEEELAALRKERENLSTTS